MVRHLIHPSPLMCNNAKQKGKGGAVHRGGGWGGLSQHKLPSRELGRYRAIGGNRSYSIANRAIVGHYVSPQRCLKVVQGESTLSLFSLVFLFLSSFSCYEIPWYFWVFSVYFPGFLRVCQVREILGVFEVFLCIFEKTKEKKDRVKVLLWKASRPMLAILADFQPILAPIFSWFYPL